MLRQILKQVDDSNVFLKSHIPPLSRQVVKSRTVINELRKGQTKNDKLLADIREELDDMTLLWTQGDEKTSNMQKLISALFMEVTDMEEHQGELNDMMN